MKPMIAITTASAIKSGGALERESTKWNCTGSTPTLLVRNAATTGQRFSRRFQKLFIRDREVHGARLIRLYGNGFLPRLRFAEDRALYAAFRKHVIGLLFADQSPAFVPRDDFVVARRDVGEFEAPGLIGDGVVRVRDDHHLGVHPDMAAVAAKVYEAGGCKRTRRGAVGKGEGQIEGGRTVHVNGVQGGIGADHAEVALLRDQENVRYVAAVLLVEVAALLGQVHSLAARNVFEINDGVGHAALRTDDQTVEIRCLLRIGIADRRVFGDGEIEGAGNWTRPFYGAGDRASVGH